MRRFNELMEAAKELNIELLNPSAEIFETAFNVYITENQIKAHSLDVDEDLLRKTFYDDMSPMERAATSTQLHVKNCAHQRPPRGYPRRKNDKNKALRTDRRAGAPLQISYHDPMERSEYPESSTTKTDRLHRS